MRGIPYGVFRGYTQWVSMGISGYQMGILRKMKLRLAQISECEIEWERDLSTATSCNLEADCRQHPHEGVRCSASKIPTRSRTWLGTDPDRIPKRSRANHGHVRDQVGISRAKSFRSRDQKKIFLRRCPAPESTMLSRRNVG
jgi:hypothetical protein